MRSGQELEEECSGGDHSCFGCDALEMKAGRRGQVDRKTGPESMTDRRRELAWKDLDVTGNDK